MTILLILWQKNVSAFCPYYKNFSDAKLKSKGLISLAEEFSKQFNNNSVVCFSVTILINIYNGKKKQVGQKEYKIYSVKRNNARKFNGRAKVCAESYEHVKERPCHPSLTSS